MITRSLSEQTTNLTYDAENHLTGAGTATFVYDGDGNRVKATIGGVTTTYIGNYFEWSGSTGTMVKYFYAGTQRVAMKKGSTVYFLLGDHLGSTTLTVDSSMATELGELRYKAWGENRFSSGTTYTNRQFTGQLNETSSIGLYYFNARYYDPLLGRFSSADSLIPDPGNPQAFDRYAYSINSPSGTPIRVVTDIVIASTPRRRFPVEKGYTRSLDSMGLLSQVIGQSRIRSQFMMLPGKWAGH